MAGSRKFYTLKSHESRTAEEIRPCAVDDVTPVLFAGNTKLAPTHPHCPGQEDLQHNDGRRRDEGDEEEVSAIN